MFDRRQNPNEKSEKESMVYERKIPENQKRKPLFLRDGNTLLWRVLY